MLLAAQRRTSRDVVVRALQRRRRTIEAPTLQSAFASSSTTSLDNSEDNETEKSIASCKRSLTNHYITAQSFRFYSRAPSNRYYSTAAQTIQPYNSRYGSSHCTFGNKLGNQRFSLQSLFINHQLAFYSSSGRESSPKRPQRTLGTTRVPTPPSMNDDSDKTSSKSMMRKTSEFFVGAMQGITGFLVKLPGNTWFFIRNPEELRQRLVGIKKLVQDEIHHYWVGFKLFWAELQTAKGLVMRTLTGSSLTRRERKQLLRTVTDLFRLVPFSMFIIIPFMEFALPFALRIFPNMLPSTFQDSLKAEETMKRELQSRISMTRFFQETLEELAKEQKRKAAKKKKELIEAGEDDVTIHHHEDSAAAMLEFLEKARKGETIPADVIIKYANYFHDDLTLDNMPRMQLINMCKYMGIPHYGSDSLLQFQLRYKIRSLREDDQRILWEGIDSLTKMELREACRERGMRSTGLSKDAYKWALQQWLDLSVNKNVPISLLIMSRTFFLRDELSEPSQDVDESKTLAAVVDAISGLDKEVVNEVILDVATADEQKGDPNIRKIKLEVLSAQNQIIRQEQEARDAAAKKKETPAKTEEKSESLDVADMATDQLDSSIPASTSESTPPLVNEEIIAAIKEVVEEEKNLSADEMEAISQLISDDPVSKERADLQRIKAAMKKEAKNADTTESDESRAAAEPISAEEVDRIANSIVQEIKEAAKQADASTTVAMDGKLSQDQASEDFEEVATAQQETEEEDDPVVRELKRRVESMVDKIEVQLTEAHVRIGDKLHFLDKDRDEIITREEMAEVLQQVLKRKISYEEALEIASTMDENKDGVFTVDELIQWIDEHKLVKFVEEGRDFDVDRVMEENASKDETEAKSVEDASASLKETKL
ncbi:hypothetical protein MPSEU_000290500 [Mayamaea pseudoterrestris]|nr:hypothetical protein MPSEU_000290500 [Mayamaea pseudoterrestris]